MTDETDVTFEVDASEAFQRLSERFLKLEREHQELKGSTDQALTQTAQCFEMITKFVSQTMPMVQDIATRLAALTMQVEKAERTGAGLPPRPPGDPSVN